MQRIVKEAIISILQKRSESKHIVYEDIHYRELICICTKGNEAAELVDRLVVKNVIELSEVIMAIGALFNVPGTQEELGQWAFAHAAHHRDIIQAIRIQHNFLLPEFVLDPFDPRSMQVWIYQHQTMHNNQNAILGIAGNDLTDVNWQDAGQLESWINLNASEHYQAGNILRIG